MSKLARRTVLTCAALWPFTDAIAAVRGLSGKSVSSLSITGVSLSNATFVGGSPSGTVVGNVSVTMSSGSFTGTLSLTGTDAASFQIVSGQLKTSGIVAVGSYSINIVATQSGAGTFTQPETITGYSASGDTSITMANLNSTTSPSNTPIKVTQCFVRGAVLAGSIAVPQVGAVDLAAWQTDARTFWDDGSLKTAVYRMILPTGIAGNGGTRQITFNIRAGSWNNASSNTTADVTGGSNYQLALANLHTAQVNQVNQQAVALTMSGGSITGGTCFYPSTLSTGTLNVSNGIGTGGKLAAVMQVATAAVASQGAGGYTNGDVVTGTTGTGTKFTLTLTVAGGTITGAAVTTGGAYTVLPSATAAPVTGGTGSGATFALTFSFQAVNVTAGGTGYVAAPSVLVGALTGGGTGGGTGAVITTTLSGSAIGSASVVSAGSAFTSLPTLSVWGGGQVKVSNGSVSVVTPGNGYQNVGTGSFSASFNGAVALVNSNGNHNGASLVQFAKGPVCDAWRARMPISGLPHYHATFYVERWKDGTGAFLVFYAYAVAGTGLIDTADTLFNYTYDFDWKNGSTVIRGTSNGDPGFTNQLNSIGSLATFNRGTAAIGYVDTARGDWSSNSLAFNSIIQQRTPTECDQYKATGVATPWLPITPTVSIPTVTASYTTDSTEDNFICLYQPMGSAGIRCPMGSGGSGHNEAPMPDSNTMHWMWLRQGNAANARVWHVNSRTAAAHHLGSYQGGGGLFDPTTFYVPNVVPAAAQTFSGMTPTLEAHTIADIPTLGYNHPMIDVQGSSLATAQPYHQPCYSAYVYLLEGEQWALDAMLHSVAAPIYAQSFTFHRQVTFGGTTYYALQANQVNNGVRLMAWPIRTAAYAAAFAPTIWADGTSNVEQSYSAYYVQSNASYLNALIGFTGNVTIGTGGGTFSKTVDYTGSGVYPELFTDTSLAVEIEVPFMDDYLAQCFAVASFVLQGTTAGGAAKAFLNYQKKEYAGLWAYAGAHFLNDSYRINSLVGPAANSAVSDSTWSSEGNAASPALAMYPHSNSGQGTPCTFAFTSGSSTVTLNVAMIFNGTSRVASGSRIKLTRTAIESGINNSVAIPGGFDVTTWYYWKELTATTGQLCTDAGLTSPVTATSTVTGMYFWVVPANTLPADNSGSGTTNGGNSPGGSSRVAVKVGTLRLMQAYGVDDSVVSVTDAITNANTIFQSVNSNVGDSAFADYPLYAWDHKLA